MREVQFLRRQPSDLKAISLSPTCCQSHEMLQLTSEKCILQFVTN